MATKAQLIENQIKLKDLVSSLSDCLAGSEIGYGKTILTDIEKTLKTPLEENLIQCGYCGNILPHYSRGLCRNCYARARLHDWNPAYRTKIKWGYDQSWQEKFVQNVLPDMQFVKPKDFDQTVEKLVDGLGGQRSAAILYERHKDQKTLEEIGAIHGVTRERIRQILGKCYRMARHQNRSRLIILGEEEKKKAEERQVQYETEDKRKLFIALKKCDLSLESIRMLLDEFSEELQAVTIYDLDLSIRSYNCIAKAIGIYGKKTLRDLFEAFVYSGEDNMADWLYSQRNLGRKSLEEIISKIRCATGIDLSYGEVET